MRFSTRVLVTQLLAAAAVVGVCVAAFALLSIQQLREETESMALAISRTIAGDPQVRDEVAEYAGERAPEGAELPGGALQSYASEVVERTDALFVVITNDRGIRLSHPDRDRLGEQVSTDFTAVLDGAEAVSWERGTLGDSVRAKVPIVAASGTAVIGEVSVGFAPGRVFADAPLTILLAVAVAAAALGVATFVAVLNRRRLERLTRGVQPEELAALLQSRAAVLEGVTDGVIAVAEDRTIRAVNDAASSALDVGEAIASPLDDVALPRRLRSAIDRALDGEPVVTGELIGPDQVLYFEVRRVSHDDRQLGAVAVLRDRTDIVALAERLDVVRASSSALRAQRHEFANRLHAVGGMLSAGRTADAQQLLADIAGADGRVDDLGSAVDEPFLRAFIGAKRIEAGERGVELRVGEDTFLVGTVVGPEDVAAVLGNLIDNAITASVSGADPRWVEVSLLDDGDDLAITVTDSGAGVDDPESLFRRVPTAENDEVDRVHGHGIGLPLARRFARRRGGELWLAQERGHGHGAVFAARLPAVMGTARDPSQHDAPDAFDSRGEEV